MVDAHSTQVLNRVIDNMPDTTSFLVDTFFPGVDVSQEETILFDTTSGRKLVTPYVAPQAEGKIIAALGYETDSFRPAYLKDKRLFDPNKGSKRLPGEKIGGELTQMQRIDRAIKANLREQIDMVGLRMEQQAGEILKLGRVTISGERYPTRVVDFKRRAENRIVLTGGDRWGEVGLAVTPWQRVDNEIQELSDATGWGPTDVIFDPLAWKLFEPSIPEKVLDKNVKDSGVTEIQMGYVTQPRDGVVYRGRSNHVRFWTYSGTYTDPEDMLTKKTLGDYEVLIGGASIDGVRHFGAIKDFSAGIQARQYFAKSRELFDPSGYEYLLQSAPLLVPYRRNNVKSLKVR
jgi:hypothetical protein